jgi:hypothetical protein
VAFSTKRVKGQTLRSDGTYAPFTKKDGRLWDSIANMVSAWVWRVWDEVGEIRTQRGGLEQGRVKGKVRVGRVLDQIYSLMRKGFHFRVNSDG